MYMLLTIGMIIEKGDEVFNIDDCDWVSVNKYSIGTQVDLETMPIRRNISSILKYTNKPNKLKKKFKRKEKILSCIAEEDENGKPNIPVVYENIFGTIYHKINGKLKKCKYCTTKYKEQQNIKKIKA